ncbi:MAG: thymidine kinase [Bacilli bacterium]|nr:thymidine kinase [Bacilli bacterium]
MAKLYFKYGAMNSGKTTVLIQTAYNYESQGMKVIVIKPSKDIKGEEKIISRVGLSRKVDYLIKDGDNIYELINNKHKDIACLLVDEVQFLEEKQIDELLMISSLLNIPVICYGLRTDFRMEGFRGSPRLLLIADKIEEIKTICKCGKKATINVRKVNNEYVFEGDQIAIDGFCDVKYESMCPTCSYKIRKI